MSSSTDIDSVAEIAPSVAEHLGDGWTAHAATHMNENPWQVWYLAHTDGVTIRLRLDENTNGRIMISGQLPTIPDGLTVETHGFHNVGATADRARPAKAIAGQISRAVLPELRERRETIFQRIAAAQRLEEDKEALRQRLRVIPGLEGGSWSGVPRGTYTYATTPSASVGVKGDRDGAFVNVDLRGLTGDQAERVLRALTEAPA